MNQVYKIEDRVYTRKSYTPTIIAGVVLPNLLCDKVANLTYGQLEFITNMYNDGWELIPSVTNKPFYDKNSDRIKWKLTSRYDWFKHVSIVDIDSTPWEIKIYYALVDYSNDNSKCTRIIVYDSEKEIARFQSYEDMNAIMTELSKSIPCKFIEYADNKMYDNTEYLENEKEITIPRDSKVYDTGNEFDGSYDYIRSNSTIGINFDRLVEIVKKSNKEKKELKS